MKPLPLLLLISLAPLALSGCAIAQTGEPVTTAASQTPTAQLATLSLPTAPPRETPSATVVLPAATAAVAPATATPQQITLHVFLIAIGDNGISGKKVGCGDSVVPVSIEVPYTTGVLRASLTALFSLKGRYYGESGLYNSLYQSDLQVQDVLLQGATATVNLAGNLRLGGECDDPRVKAQIEETALQFSTVHEVKVFLNGETLDQALSLK